MKVLLIGCFLFGLICTTLQDYVSLGNAKGYGYGAIPLKVNAYGQGYNVAPQKSYGYSPAYNAGISQGYGQSHVDYGKAAPVYNAGYGKASQSQGYGHDYTPAYGPQGYGNAYGALAYDVYDTMPGAYNKEAYQTSLAYGRGPYNLHQISATYLYSDAHQRYNKYCNKGYGYGQTPQITKYDIETAVDYANHLIHKLTGYQQQVSNYGGYYNASHVSYYGRNQIRSYGGDRKEQNRRQLEGLFMELMTQYLVKYKCLSKTHVSTFLPQVKLYGVKNPYGKGYCNGYRPSKGCNPYDRYRTIDGECNNLYHRYWGKSYVCHLRFLAAAYEDGVSAPRALSVTYKQLPNPRTISRVMHYQTRHRTYYTSGVMSFGQLVWHDISLTSQWSSEYSGTIKCCPKPTHHQCYPIMIPYNDYHYSKYRVNCLEFVRSKPCPLCSTGQREQQNDVTSFIDYSVIYGSTYEVARSLRAYKYGYLKTSKDIYGRDILPHTLRPYENQCYSPNKNIPCYLAGDLRVNQQPGLSEWHLIGVRMHNYHARYLYQLNPKWSDERLYQEARRLTIAEYQMVVYNEWMPVLLGQKMVDYYNLRVVHPGYSYYDPKVDPTSWNEAVTAAGRWGHSNIPNAFGLFGYNSYGKSLSYYGYNNYSANMKYWTLKDWWFNPTLMKDGWHDAQMRGFWIDLAYRSDPSIADSVTQYLFKAPYAPFGADLAAFNIQRGRDHGIPPYHAMVQFCFNIKFYSWKDLERFIPKLEVQYLQRVYASWKDIDFWTAGLMEKKMPDATVGPTFGCLIGIQFYHAKQGDRYFFTHGYQAGSFTPAQLENIRYTSTLASMYCKASDNLKYVPLWPFLPTSKANPMVECAKLPGLNYRLFSDKGYY